MQKINWKSPQAEAWCRNFGYEDYLLIHNKLQWDELALTKEQYEQYCKEQNIEMVKHFAESNKSY